MEGQSTGLIDSHCHVSSRELVGEWQEVLERAAQAGVRGLIDIGTTPAESQEIVERLEKWQGAAPKVRAGVGLHPHESVSFEPSVISKLRALAQGSRRVVAIGEMGVDHHYTKDATVHLKQEESFRAQMALAAELDLPFVVHSRDAAVRTVELLREEQARRGRGQALRGVMHCFTGDAAFALACVELGMHISFSGIVTYKNALEIQAAAKATPPERILVETDAPFLSPEPLRGNKYYPNEPARVIHTAKFVAQLRGEAFEKFAARSFANTVELFRLPL